MNAPEEFDAAVDRLEQIVTQLALLTISLRRLELELRPKPKPPEEGPDFDYRTGQKPHEPVR